MRFFIGCTEICGMVSIYANELRRLGYEVTTCINGKHPFFADNDYDIQSNYWADYILGRNTNKPVGTPISFLNKAAVKLRTKTSLFDSFISKRIFDKHDVFIFIWAGDYLMRNGKDLEILKKKGKKIVSILVGSDVRYPQAFQQEFGTDTSGWPKKYKNPYSYYNQVLRTVELYSDLIFSVPDQAGLAIRAYDHFPIPLIQERYKFHWADHDVPVVVHAPSASALKGTDLILATFERLKNEGFKFETRFIQNMKNPDLVKLLSESDILVDELVLHGPGVLSFEAMLCGCVAATHFYQQSPESFRPPVCVIDNNNLYEVIKKLITDKEFRKQKAYEGRAYAEKHNNVTLIVQDILNKLSQQNPETVYRPLFFRDHFALPAHENISKKDKELNRIVAEKWMPDYHEHKKDLEQRNLI
jgi:hypothetical protein